MAVGSQKIAIAYKAAEKSFSIVRKINPEGIIFANIGADATIADAQKTVEMVQANALQLHLNVPQELAMREGRRKFKGTLENILHIAQNIKVPVIVKEVGFGMSQDEAKLLVDNKIQILDIGGYGGTNFVAIENARNKSLALKSLENWGIPTAPSLIEVVNKVGSDADIICSGGLETGLDVAKALALGAKAAALAGSPLYILYKEGTSALCKHILNMERVLKYTMAMSGANNILELGQRPTVVIGKTREWLKYRGIRA
jgi:isopentenyl-diphosphate delta-isomerase